MTSLIPQDRRLGVGTKALYGSGYVVFGVVSLGLSSSLMGPYLTRVIGIPAFWVGTVLMLSLVIDAFLDPAMGRFSDRLRTRWGRRHPLMYASAPLVVVACIAFWNSPTDWSLGATGAYVIGWLIALRLAVSLYEVPNQALAPELTTDYDQRTSLFSYRFFFGVVGGIGMNVVLYQVFLSPERGGVLNRAGYGEFGILAAFVMLVSILASSLGTHRRIPYLSVPEPDNLSMGQAVAQIVKTLSNPALLVVMISGLCSGVATGLTNGLSQYFYLELWGLDTRQLSYLSLAGVAASVSAVMVAAPAARWLGKKKAMLTLFWVYLFTFAAPLTLKLLGLMPPNSSPWVFRILLIDIFVAVTLAIAGLIIISSMVADVVEDSAVQTGVRSEGLLLAVNGLLPKVTAGIGVFIVGILLTLVDFPIDARQGAVGDPIMLRLALIYLPIAAGMTALSIAVLYFYRIDKAKHEENLATLRDAAAIAASSETIEAKAVAGAPPVA